nr:hypothetical protein [uncultured archaeon]
MEIKMKATTKIALEDEISRAIMAENGCTAHFEYKSEMDIDELPRIINVMTYNPKTRETFLLKEVTSNSDEEGLMKISEYVKNHKLITILILLSGQKSEVSQSCSHFYYQDALEVLEKFFFNKQREDYVIYSLSMNPKA